MPQIHEIFKRAKDKETSHETLNAKYQEARSVDIQLDGLLRDIKIAYPEWEVEMIRAGSGDIATLTKGAPRCKFGYLYGSKARPEPRGYVFCGSALEGLQPYGTFEEVNRLVRDFLSKNANYCHACGHNHEGGHK